MNKIVKTNMFFGGLSGIKIYFYIGVASVLPCLSSILTLLRQFLFSFISIYSDAFGQDIVSILTMREDYVYAILQNIYLFEVFLQLIKHYL